MTAAKIQKPERDSRTGEPLTTGTPPAAYGHAFNVIGLAALTLALTLDAIDGHADRWQLALLAFGGLCFTARAVLHGR